MYYLLPFRSIERQGRGRDAAGTTERHSGDPTHMPRKGSSEEVKMSKAKCRSKSDKARRSFGHAPGRRQDRKVTRE